MANKKITQGKRRMAEALIVTMVQKIGPATFMSALNCASNEALGFDAGKIDRELFMDWIAAINVLQDVAEKIERANKDAL